MTQKEPVVASKPQVLNTRLTATHGPGGETVLFNVCDCSQDGFLIELYNIEKRKSFSSKQLTTIRRKVDLNKAGRSEEGKAS